MSGSLKDHELIRLGSIGGALGLQGWVKILSDSSPKKDIFNYQEWQLKSTIDNKPSWSSKKLLQSRPQGKGLVAKLEGVTDRTQAEKLLGSEIYVHKSELEQLSDNDFYWHELIGLQVINQNDVDYGKVDYLLATGANDVLIVKQDVENGKPKETLVPYIWDQVIKKVDLDAKQILVDWDLEYLD